MNYANTAPGSEWSYTGYNWNPSLAWAPRREPECFASRHPRGGRREDPLYQRAGERRLYRHLPLQRLYLGAVRIDSNNGATIWIDLNGDGVQHVERSDRTAPLPGI